MTELSFDDIEIYNSVYKYIDSNMYLFISDAEALVIDPHTDADVEKLFKINDIQKVTIILTHEHCDHISGIWWFLENYDCSLICSEECSKRIATKKHTRPLLLLFTIEENDKKNGTNNLEKFKKEYVWTTYKSDFTYSDESNYTWQGHDLYFKIIHGHSPGSSFIIFDGKYVFTGDSLLKNYPVIVSFPQGDKIIYLEETLPLLESTLSSDMTIFPGHGKPFVLSEIMNGDKINVELR